MADALEEQNHDSHLGESPGVFQSPDLRFVENTEIFLGGGVGSLRGGAEGFEFMTPVCSAEHLDNQHRGSLIDIISGNVQVTYTRRAHNQILREVPWLSTAANYLLARRCQTDPEVPMAEASKSYPKMTVIALRKSVLM
jgi:hypothetical protein